MAESCVDYRLPAKAIKQMIGADIAVNQIERDADNLGGKHVKNVWYDNEPCPGQQTPAIFPKKFI